MNCNLNDKDIMNDVLSFQKNLTGIYNTFSNECVNDSLRTDMMNILREEHDIQYDVFSEMQKRGWYAPPSAEQSAVEQAKYKFQAVKENL